MNAATQVFGDFVYALKCSARLFVGAMPRANATLGAVGAGALTVDAHAYRDKRNTDNSQYNNIDRCHSKPPLVNQYLLYLILHLPKGASLFWLVLSAETPHLPHQKARMSLGHSGSWKGVNTNSNLSGNCSGSSVALVFVGPCMFGHGAEDLEEHRSQQHNGHNRPDTKLP